MARDDFSKEVRRILADRVNGLCSNPRCKRPTKGPHTDDDKAARIGKASHIHAASPGGPRYDPRQAQDERRSAKNGIWLCSNCATGVDVDEERFPASLLRTWREQAEQEA